MAIKLGTTDITDFKVGSTDVDKIYLGSTEVWSKSPTPPATVKALKFTASGSQTLGIDSTVLGTITPSFEYSTDDGTTWTTWNIANTLSFGNGTDLYVRGSNTFLALADTNYTHFVFGTSEPVACSGNVMHLFDYTQDLTAFPDDVSLSSRGIKNMFKSCSVLTSAPELPATTLPQAAYYNLFQGCTALTVSPNLPATIFGGVEVYRSMFEGCTSLVTPSALPALTLVGSDYFRMFYGCSVLNKIPALPATVLGSSCYNFMFRNCPQIKMSNRNVDPYLNYYVFGTDPANYSNGMFIGTGGELIGAGVQTMYTANEIIS